MSVASSRDLATVESPAGDSDRSCTLRVAGFSALAFVAGVLVSNGALFGGPLPDSAMSDAASWLEAHRGRAMLASAMVALTFPALLIFGASLFELGRDVGGARLWLLVGALGGAAMVGVFSIVVVGSIGALQLAATGGEGFAAAWILHNAAFAVNMTVLGTAFLGFALGAHAAGLTPGWQRTLGVIGAVLLLVTGFANAAVSSGSPLVFIGLPGFLLWLVWLTVTGIRLLRLAADS